MRTLPLWLQKLYRFVMTALLLSPAQVALRGPGRGTKRSGRVLSGRVFPLRPASAAAAPQGARSTVYAVAAPAAAKLPRPGPYIESACLCAPARKKPHLAFALAEHGAPAERLP